MPCTLALPGRRKYTPHWRVQPHKSRGRGDVYEVCLIHCQTQVERARNVLTAFFCMYSVLYAWNK